MDTQHMGQLLNYRLPTVTGSGQRYSTWNVVTSTLLTVNKRSRSLPLVYKKNLHAWWGKKQAV